MLLGRSRSDKTTTAAATALAVWIDAAGAGSRIHDLGVTGSGPGVRVDAVTGVLLERLWIHQTAALLSGCFPSVSSALMDERFASERAHWNFERTHEAAACSAGALTHDFFDGRLAPREIEVGFCSLPASPTPVLR